MDFIKYLSEKHKINLSEQQQKAVLNIEGPILLLAVPGGGKTTVIVSRCANMVINHKIDPETILTLTFSKASALDMKHRFQKVFGEDVNRDLRFSTIHSFCFYVLKAYYQKTHNTFPTIIEDEKAPITKSQLLRQITQKVKKIYLSDDKVEELSSAISYIKNMMIPENEIEVRIPYIDDLYEVFKLYETTKIQNNFIDFDDMLMKTLEIFQSNKDLINSYRNKYKYINIDESQDTSYLQHEIIKCLASPKNNIFMVGDEDQSIYSFRAAFPKALLDFEKTYPGARIFLMENNYRSTKSIVNAANKFIKQNQDRHNKNMFSNNDEGTPAKFISLKDRNDQNEYLLDSIKKETNLAEIAVLYRNNVSAIPLADAFSRNGVPFFIREAKIHFFKHWVTNDIISFMNLSQNLNDIEAFSQIYYKMNAYLSKAAIELATANRHTNADLFDALLSISSLNEKQRLKMNEIRYNLVKMSKMKALDAIEFIVNVLEYGDYLKKQNNSGSDSTDSLLQIISGLKNIAAKTSTMEDFKHRLDQLQKIMDSAKFNKGKNAVTFSTIHSSKGLEFDKVYIIDLYDGQFPTANSISEFNDGNKALMEEEVRLFYVGATRARQKLELITTNFLDGRKVKPSRFINRFMSAYEKPKVQTSSQNEFVHPNEYVDTGNITVKDLVIGAMVVHKKYGMGDIRAINQKADLLEICFAKSGLRIFSLKICLSGDILHLANKIDTNNGSNKNVLREELNNTTNMDVKALRELALSIGETGEKRELLPELFRNPDYEIRRRACSAAKKLRDNNITKHIVPCLYDKEPQIRQYALSAVLSSKCKDVLGHIREVNSKDDKDYNVKLCEEILKRLSNNK